MCLAKPLAKENTLKIFFKKNTKVQRNHRGAFETNMSIFLKM